MIPRLFRAFGNIILLDWTAAQLKKEDKNEKEEMLSFLTYIIDALEKMRGRLMQMEKDVLHKDKVRLSDVEEKAPACP